MNYDVLNNRYKLIEKIGMGGMAIVYKGIDLRLSRTIAIKVLKDELLEKSEFIKRFEIEAQSVASLSHPNIVPVYDIGDFNDIHFIIMEYINGKSLKELILKEKVLSIDSIINLFIQLCRAIDHAHENDIIHRDIKPHNILISKNSKIKVTDFGIAKIISQSTLTQDGSFMGSAYYFSPEQAKGEKADFRSDIYSLGITLYEMLTGSLPFQGDHLIAVVMQQVQKEPDFNHKRFKMLPAGFENILKKMLEKDPTNRYQNIKDLMIDLYSVIKLDTNSLYEKYKFKETIKSSKNTINQPTTVKKHNSQYKIKSSINNTHNKTDNPNEVKSSTDKNIISNKGKNDFYKVIKSVMPQVTSNSFPQNTNYINYKDLETYEIIKLYDDKLFSGLSNGQVKIWNLNTKKCLHSILAAQNPIKYLTIFKNILATTSANNNTIQIWDIKTGKLL
ncbi:MAG: protein kinase, partial [Clostridiales bacterium]